MKPKKYLGQHFLTDRNIADRIVGLLTAGPEDPVVEIGPGKGVLTELLLPRFPRLQLVEIDDEAVSYLRQHLSDFELKIIHEDVLKWDLPADTLPDSYFIGNLPYNISSPIFFKLLDHLTYVREGVFMIQKEVAQRLCAKEGSKTYGILSVLLGYYFDLKYAFTVMPGAFYPPPRVQSGVIYMRRKENVEPLNFSAFKRVVKAGFGQRRKTLRNALKGLEITDFEGKEEMMSLRAEQVDIAGFVRLTHAYEAGLE